MQKQNYVEVNLNNLLRRPLKQAFIFIVFCSGGRTVEGKPDN